MKPPMSRYRWSGKTLHTCGLTARVHGVVASDEVGEQIDLILVMLDGILAENGLTSDDVISINVFLASMSDMDVLNAACARYFREPYPVRTTVQVGLGEGVLVEVNAQACAA